MPLVTILCREIAQPKLAQTCYNCIRKMDIGACIVMKAQQPQLEYSEELRLKKGTSSLQLYRNNLRSLHSINQSSHTVSIIQQFLTKENIVMIQQPPYVPNIASHEVFTSLVQKGSQSSTCSTLNEMKAKSQTTLKELHDKLFRVFLESENYIGLREFHLFFK